MYNDAVVLYHDNDIILLLYNIMVSNIRNILKLTIIGPSIRHKNFFSTL